MRSFAGCLTRISLVVISIGGLSGRNLFGQGGPPMITDDPGTPRERSLGKQHRRPNEWSIDAPAIGLNYGWGDHIQLTLQTSLAILKGSDQ
jgi:hypothetical protein